MYVKKFEGDTLDDALKSVKHELGPDAIILKTVTNKGLKGAFKKNRIEITAAVSEQTYAKKARVDHVMSEDQKEAFYNSPARSINNMINEYDENSMPSRNSQVEQKPSGYGSMGLNKVVNTVSKASNKIRSSLDDFLSVEEEAQSSESNLNKFLEEKKEVQKKLEKNYEPQIESHYETSQSTQTHSVVNPELEQEVKSQSHQIELLEQKLYELTQKITDGPKKNQNRAIETLRNSLRSLELSENIIVEIVKKASFEFTKEELEDSDLLFDFALRHINQIINVGMPKFSQASEDDKPAITVLVSESSCGQAAMAVKLGVLRPDIKIIQFRAAQNNQINNDFTRKMFDLDINMVSNLSNLMSEVRKATAENRSIILDLRLNFPEMDETKRFIETLRRSFDNVEIITSISAIHSEVYNRKILSKYEDFSSGVIISYIDQCLSFGALVNLGYEYSNKPYMFFGTGPTTPDDMEAATKERILAGLFQL